MYCYLLNIMNNSRLILNKLAFPNQSSENKSAINIAECFSARVVATGCRAGGIRFGDGRRRSGRRRGRSENVIEEIALVGTAKLSERIMGAWINEIIGMKLIGMLVCHRRHAGVVVRVIVLSFPFFPVVQLCLRCHLRCPANQSFVS